MGVERGFETSLGELVSIARQRVQSGEISARSLARLCGVSQPHMQNVFSEIRGLSPASADRLLAVLQIQLRDLVWGNEEEIEEHTAAIPVLKRSIGPGFYGEPFTTRGIYPMRKADVAGLIDPLIGTLSPDPLMPSELSAGDLVLLDQNPKSRANPTPSSLWVIEDEGGRRARYIAFRSGKPCVADRLTIGNPAQWQAIAQSGRNILDVARARIVWISRKMETEPTR
jgi:hypothetical protein